MADETVLNLFVSSPGDVQARARAGRRSSSSGSTPNSPGAARIRAIRWETRYYSSHDTFQAQIPEAADCDLVVAIFGARLGSPLPETFPPHADRRAVIPAASAYEVLSAIEARRRGQGVPDIYVFRRPQRAAGRARRRRPRRDRSAMAAPDRLLRDLVSQPQRRVSRGVPGIPTRPTNSPPRSRIACGNGWRGAVSPPRARRGTAPAWLALPRPRGVRRKPAGRLLRPRARRRPGDPPPARGRGAGERRRAGARSCC